MTNYNNHSSLLQKTIVVSILGLPNCGKSTFLNQIVGQKIAIVTPKRQTTRSMITGIITQEHIQYVFLDTPGIFTPQKPLEKAMMRCAWSSMRGADLVLLMIDASLKLNRQVIDIINKLISQKIHFCVVLNKIDICRANILTALVKELQEIVSNYNIFFISATKGTGIEPLFTYLASIAPIRPWLYDKDEVTNVSMRFLAQEITREQLFLQLHQELPYNITVLHEKWEQQHDGSIKIYQAIIVNKANYKSMIIGKQGQRIKTIGQNARIEMQRTFNLAISLYLFVKVEANWEQDYSLYNAMGLKRIKNS